MKRWQKWLLGGAAGLGILTGGAAALPHWTDSYAGHRPAQHERKPGKLEHLIDLHGSRTIPLLYLQGSPYDIGWQRGTALKDRILETCTLFDTNISQKAREHIPVPVLDGILTDLALWRAHERLEEKLPARYKAELRGMADASGASLRDFKRHLALSELFSASCSTFAAMHTATEDGRLIQTRNLDWDIEFNAQEQAVIEAVKPEGKHAYVSVGFAGFPGVLTGINEHGISISEIGTGSAAKTLDGIPMVYLTRQVLEEAKTLDEAIGIIKGAPRTGGYTYIIGSARERKAAALETNSQHCAVFSPNDPAEARNPHALPLKDVLVRGAWAVDETIRERQTACGGDTDKPGCEPPKGGGYRTRYLQHAELIAARLAEGRPVDLPLAFSINRQVAMDSNIQSIVYDYGNSRMYVRIARGYEPKMGEDTQSIIAAGQPPFIVDLDTVFRKLNGK